MLVLLDEVPFAIHLLVLALTKGIGCYPVTKMKIPCILAFFTLPLGEMYGYSRPETLVSFEPGSQLEPSQMGCLGKPALRYCMISHRRAIL